MQALNLTKPYFKQATCGGLPGDLPGRTDTGVEDSNNGSMQGLQHMTHFLSFFRTGYGKAVVALPGVNAQPL